jgi:hypothetical protein
VNFVLSLSTKSKLGRECEISAIIAENRVESDESSNLFEAMNEQNFEWELSKTVTKHKVNERFVNLSLQE